VELTRMGGCAPGCRISPPWRREHTANQAGSARERILPHFPYPPRGAQSAPFRIFRLAFARNREYSFEGSLYGLRKTSRYLRPDPIGVGDFLLKRFTVSGREPAACICIAFHLSPLGS